MLRAGAVDHGALRCCSSRRQYRRNGTLAGAGHCLNDPAISPPPKPPVIAGLRARSSQPAAAPFYSAPRMVFYEPYSLSRRKGSKTGKAGNRRRGEHGSLSRTTTKYARQDGSIACAQIGPSTPRDDQAREPSLGDREYRAAPTAGITSGREVIGGATCRWNRFRNAALKSRSGPETESPLVLWTG